MFTLMKKRRGYLDEAKKSEAPADLGEEPMPSVGLTGDMEGEGEPEAETPEEHRELADHYQALADYHREKAGPAPEEGPIGEEEGGGKKPALALAIGIGKPKEPYETPEADTEAEEKAEPFGEEAAETPEEETAEPPAEEEAETKAGTEVPPKKGGASKFNLFRKKKKGGLFA